MKNPITPQAFWFGLGCISTVIIWILIHFVLIALAEAASTWNCDEQGYCWGYDDLIPVPIKKPEQEKKECWWEWKLRRIHVDDRRGSKSGDWEPLQIVGTFKAFDGSIWGRKLLLRRWVCE